MQHAEAHPRPSKPGKTDKLASACPGRVVCTSPKPVEAGTGQSRCVFVYRLFCARGPSAPTTIGGPFRLIQSARRAETRPHQAGLTGMRAQFFVDRQDNV